MACTTPQGALSIAARGTLAKSFYMPEGNGLVNFAWTLAFPSGYSGGGVGWTLKNSLDQVLASGSLSPGSSSVNWSLGANDPHVLTFTNSIQGLPSGLKPTYLPITFSYWLDGACTTSQGQAPGCVPDPCAPGCKCIPEGPTGSAYACECPTGCTPPCPAGHTCNPYTNSCSCPANTCCPACTGGQVCVAGQGGVGTCETPAPTCTPACTGGQLCVGGACKCPVGQVWNGSACVVPVPPPGPTATNSSEALVAVGGLAALLGVMVLVSRSRAAHGAASPPLAA